MGFAAPSNAATSAPAAPASSSGSANVASNPKTVAAQAGTRCTTMRCITNTDRAAAAKRSAASRVAARKITATPQIVGRPKPASAIPVQPGCQAPVANPGGVPDYMTGCVGNYANSPLPVISGGPATVGAPDPVTGLWPYPTYTGTITGGLRKFMDLLPSIPVAVPDTITYPGSDYYEISLIETPLQMHADLPNPTLVHVYQQTNKGTDGSGANTIAPPAVAYLGPLIVAQQNRPVRVKFTNALPANGSLFIPVDTTLMGAGPGPDGSAYSQNRANLHLHGGATPWISDGTPQQWTVPAGEVTNFPKGMGTIDVPDMPPTGTGKMTIYWTNQQSARLMFYHDHALGITRLNVYAGSAAGYLLQDPVEATLVNGGTITPPVGAAAPVTVAPGTIPANQYALVIQDKTFIPPPDQLAAQDPTWNWGPKDANGNFLVGSLWFPHVYMTNQNPSDNSGINSVGRWDWGPWFWPPVDPSQLLPAAAEWPCPTAANPTQMCPGVPMPSLVPEAFVDTPVINGKAYPVLQVNPQAYRFRILNACNDRSVNLTLYEAVDSTQTVCTTPPGAPNPATPGPATCTEVRQITAPDGVAAQGPIPDPATKGPSMIQIGTEGGLMPNPVVLPNQPITYNYNRRDIVVLNVQNKNLWMGPAERADVIVDFSQYAGKTLILYNDSPAPAPAFDTRNDYYTSDPDQTAQGGAPTTLPGYGPNTRTMMQIQVAATAPAAPYNLTALQAALPAAFAASQPAPIIPEAAYATAYPSYSPTVNSYARIQDTSVFTGSLTGFTVTAGGTGYTSAPLVTIDAPAAGGTQAVGTATVAAGAVTGITLTNAGTGYYSTPLVTLTGGGGTGATALAVGVPMLRKTIQELFELNYGRMNAILGLELPFTNFNTQTTIPMGYVDPPTESFVDGQPQLWKITHNGVDTHSVHVHLFNVQVINRVGWDGAVRAPDANEIGWKETVKMSPLEDVIVAFKPVKQTLPFSLPDSIRPEDTTVPVGATIGVVDPTTGNVTNISNPVINYGQEYVWHCHLLGHEENDMMRSMIFQVAPDAPTNLAAPVLGGVAHLSFTNNAAAVVQSNAVAGTTGYTIQRDIASTFPNPVTLATVAPVLGSKVGSLVKVTDATIAAGTVYYYRVQSFTPNGTSAWSNVAQIFADAPIGNLELAVDPVTSLPTIVQNRLNGKLFVRGWVADPLDGSPLRNVRVYIDGVSIGAPTLGLARPDVATYFNNPAYANSGYSLSYNSSNLKVGTHQVTVVAINSGGVSQTFGPLTITVVNMPGPVGHLDMAVDSGTSQTTIKETGTLWISGWVADPTDGSPLNNVTVHIDGISIGTPTLGGARPDVATFYNNPAYGKSGYTMTFPAATLSAGSHTITVTAINSSGVSANFGPSTITVTDNIPPIGMLDGAVDKLTGTSSVSRADSLYVYGWAADYGNNGSATRVRILIDGTSVGNATLGVARPDVATYLNKPTWANTGWSYTASASTLSVGAHTVTAVAYDAAGNTTTLGPASITVH